MASLLLCSLLVGVLLGFTAAAGDEYVPKVVSEAPGFQRATTDAEMEQFYRYAFHVSLHNM